METAQNQEQTKTLYFISICDDYGQRTGRYKRIYLSDDEIEFNHMGWKLHKGTFLYESQPDILFACLD